MTMSAPNPETGARNVVSASAGDTGVVVPADTTLVLSWVGADASRAEQALGVPQVTQEPELVQALEAIAAGQAGRWTEAANTKTDNGMAFPKQAYAYAPDNTPSHWKVRLWETPEKHETAAQVGRAASALTGVPAADLPAVKKAVLAAWKRVNPNAKPADAPMQLRESIDGERTFGEVSSLLEDAIEDKLGIDDSMDGGVFIKDVSMSYAVYTVGCNDDLFQVGYTLDDAGTVTIGDPQPSAVAVTYTPATDGEPGEMPEVPVQEAVRREDRIEGRVVEAKGTDDAGGRIFGVRIIAVGESKNSRNYPARVLEAAVPLYEGAKAFDHHRTPAELTSSTIDGLVGSYRNVHAEQDGIYGDLCLLPSATHTVEALQASLANQAQGLPPLVGISHDVAVTYRPVVTGGRRFMEATAILAVNSADVVADPAAGGQATRMVAGGPGDPTPTGDTNMTLKQLLELLRGADAAKRAELLSEHASVLEGAGYIAEDVPTLLGEDPELVGAAASAPPASSATATESRTTEARATHSRDSMIGRTLIAAAMHDAKMDGRLVESVRLQLPDSFTEAELVERISGLQTFSEGLEKAGLTPTVGGDVRVTEDEVDKKRSKLDAFFDGNFAEGYHSFKQAWADFTGFRGDYLGEDINRRILRESVGGQAYDSAERSTESVTSTTWNLALGDSITRRLIAAYNHPNLSVWKSIVSSIVPVNDFRTQRLDRLGEYGVLPTVAQGAPYQPLTSPTNEEVTYSVGKYGGTEDLTIETIANDDIGAVRRIPNNLGLATAITQYRFVFDLINTNATCTYDSTALFAAGHANTNTSTLSDSAMGTVRTKMRKQAAYGNSVDILSLVPRFLLVTPENEEIAYQIANSAFAVGANANTATGANVSNLPNLHGNTQVVVVDYWSATSTTEWFVIADPSMVPTIEMGFYQGRSEPELFVQNDPTVGSVFNADKITWKVRSIWGGAVLDHRGFQRGNV